MTGAAELIPTGIAIPSAAAAMAITAKPRAVGGSCSRPAVSSPTKSTTPPSRKHSYARGVEVMEIRYERKWDPTSFTCDFTPEMPYRRRDRRVNHATAPLTN